MLCRSGQCDGQRKDGRMPQSAGRDHTRPPRDANTTMCRQDRRGKRDNSKLNVHSKRSCRPWCHFDKPGSVSLAGILKPHLSLFSARILFLLSSSFPPAQSNTNPPEPRIFLPDHTWLPFVRCLTLLHAPSAILALSFRSRTCFSLPSSLYLTSTFFRVIVLSGPS